MARTSQKTSKLSFPYKFGWLPDIPDPRDYTREKAQALGIIKKFKKNFFRCGNWQMD